MRVNIQARGVWEAINPGNAEYRIDRAALAAILQGMPSEMLVTLAVKDNAKQAWDAVKTMRMSVERVWEAKAQALLKEFDAIHVKSNEPVDDFIMQLTGLVNNIRTLGETLEDVKKFLCVVPSKFTQVAISIE